MFDYQVLVCPTSLGTPPIEHDGVPTRLKTCLPVCSPPPSQTLTPSCTFFICLKPLSNCFRTATALLIDNCARLFFTLATIPCNQTAVRILCPLACDLTPPPTPQRYHHYIECDAAFAESIVMLQAPWQTGIVANVLHGLPRGTVSSNAGDDDTLSEDRSDDSSEAPRETNGGNTFLNENPSHDDATVRKVDDEGKKLLSTGDSHASENGFTAMAGKVRKEGREEVGDAEGGDDCFEINIPLISLGALAETRETTRSLENPWTSARGSKAGSAGRSVPASPEDDAPPDKKASAPRDTAAAYRGGKKRWAPPGDEEQGQIPEELKEGMQRCLDEACEVFRWSIRRSVLNYVLLDAGQRKRLGASI